MENIFNYINGFGNKTFQQKTFNKIDALIFSQLAYIPFEGIAGASLRSALNIQKAAALFNEKKDKTNIVWKNDPKLLNACAESERYKNIKISGYVNELKKDDAKQFSAVIFTINNNLRFLAFRGTDHSFEGWEEDFNLYSRSSLPSQRRAPRS